MGQEKESLLARPIFAALFVLAFALIAGSLALTAVGALRGRGRLATGAARWIWYPRDATEPAPLSFYAAREFLLAAKPAAAPARIFVDRRGALFVNFTRFELRERRPGDALEVFDVASALTKGRNRVLIRAESPTGPGGILFALDLPGSPLVSDGRWRVALDSGELMRGGGVPALVWGRPPMFPWGYPGVPQSPTASAIRLSRPSRAATQQGFSSS